MVNVVAKLGSRVASSMPPSLTGRYIKAACQGLIWQRRARCAHLLLAKGPGWAVCVRPDSPIASTAAMTPKRQYFFSKTPTGERPFSRSRANRCSCTRSPGSRSKPPLRKSLLRAARADPRGQSCRNAHVPTYDMTASPCGFVESLKLSSEYCPARASVPTTEAPSRTVSTPLA